MMRNPNNHKIPNLYLDTPEAAKQWLGKAELLGLKPYFDDPMEHIGKGLTMPEAMFLKQEMGRIRTIMMKGAAK